MSERIAYLQLIAADTNNNRFYRMSQEGNIIVVEMGRNGAAPVVQKKPASLWDSIYRKKIAEGYVETADLHVLEKKEVQGEKYIPVKDESVRKFFDSIMHYANKELETKYLVSWADVTQEQIDRARMLIDEMSVSKDILECQNLLVELFAVIPRKMKNVKDHLPWHMKSMPHIIEKEYELLDIMAAKVLNESESILKQDMTVLDALGLNIRPVSKKEEEQIIKHLSKESAPHYKRAFRVENHKTDARFAEYMKKKGMSDKDISYLYHGSRNSNYYGLLTRGPLLYPDAPVTGKMFGQGLYFANRARKSIGYTSLNGSYWAVGKSQQAFLAVYKVCYKNAKHLSEWKHEMSRYNAKKIAPHDAVFAHGGADLINDEIIIYDEAACTLQYIIELC